MRKTLSIAIITQDEEANLERTLPTMAWADEIVVVDSGSRDHSEEIARTHCARFFDEAWKGLAAQKNSAVDKCTCDWVLALNADEALSDGLAKEIRAVLEDESALDGYAIPCRNLFLGHRMRFGDSSRKPKLRMFRRGSAEFEPSRFHERLHFVGKAGLLHGHLAAYGYPTLYAYIEHVDSYSRSGAKSGAAVPQDQSPQNLGMLEYFSYTCVRSWSSYVQLFLIKSCVYSRARGYTYTKNALSFLSFMSGVLLRPMARFLYHYILLLGFLDGREGLLLHMYHSIYLSWKHAKAWEASRGL